MAITVVDSVSAGSPDTHSVTSGAIDSATATGLIGAVVGYIPGGGGGAGIFGDNKINLWTPRTPQSTSDITLRFFDALSSPVVGAGHTFTVTGTGIFASEGVGAIAGSGLFDQENGADATNVSALSAGGLTPSENNAIVLTAIATRNNSGTFTIDDPNFTILEQFDNDGNHFAFALAVSIQTTATPVDPEWAWPGGAQDAVAVILSIKAAGGSGVLSWLPQVRSQRGRISVVPSGQML